MINGKKYITINTDAGWHNEKKIATYAFWIKTDEQTIKTAGRLKNFPVDVHLAEMMCIMNALQIACSGRNLIGVDVIVINTDSKAAIHAFTNQVNNVNYKYKDIRLKFDELYTNKLTQKINFKHVKGHSGGDSGREYINKWCDQEARKNYTKRGNVDKY